MSLDMNEMKALLQKIVALKAALQEDFENLDKLLLSGPYYDVLQEHMQGYMTEIKEIDDAYFSVYNEAKRYPKVMPLEEETGKYPEHIMRDVRENKGLEPDDTSHDADIMEYMSRGEVLDAVAEWDGLIGYSHRIRSWVKDIYGIDLDDLPLREWVKPQPEISLDVDSPDFWVGKWRVLFAEPGDPCPRCTDSYNDCNAPIVLFYDMSQDPDRFPHGQYVSEYYAHTILGEGPFEDDLRTSGTGLSLNLEVPEWTVTAHDMKPIADWVGKKMEAYQARKQMSGPSLNDMMSSAAKRVAEQGSKPDEKKDLDRGVL